MEGSARQAPAADPVIRDAADDGSLQSHLIRKCHGHKSFRLVGTYIFATIQVIQQCSFNVRVWPMLKKVRTIALVATLMGSSYICGAVSAESHLDTSITLLRSSIKEAIQCGGGGPDGAGCKGPRGEAIKLMNRALDLLNASR